MLFVFAEIASAIVINGYTPAANNRFSSGFPSNPVANTDAGFIGLGYDWSGVGWMSYDTSGWYGYVVLDAKHFLYPNHYSPSVGSLMQFTPADGQIKSYLVQGKSGSLAGDLAAGTFSSPIPATDNVRAYPIYFQGYNNNPSYSPYDNLQLLMYGKTAHIGYQTINTEVEFAGDAGRYYNYRMVSTPNNFISALEEGDSGSPSFYSPLPGVMYLTGDHYGYYTNSGTTYGVDSFLGVMLPQLIGYTSQTGYLPYVVTPTTATWTANGTKGSGWGTNANWSTNQVPADTLFNGQVDKAASVLFDGASSTQSTITLGVDRTVTSIAFAGGAFTISAGNTLTIGEAGLTNQANNTQTLACNIELRISQRWNAGQGGLLVTGTINTGTGNMLLVDGAGNTSLNGIISGAGRLAKDGQGILTLNGANTYSGATFINNGTVQLGNALALGSTAAGTVVQYGGALNLNGLAIGNESLSIAGNGSGSYGALVNNNPTASATLNGPVSLAGNATVGGSGNLTLNGSMNYGTFALTKNGAGTLKLTGAQFWGNNSTVTVQSGVLSFQQAIGAATTVAANNSTIHIAPGAAMNVDASNNDPFTDDTISSRHVRISTDATANFNLTAGAASVNGISGNGTTTLSGGSHLNSNYIFQDALIVGSGSVIVINPLGASADSSNLITGSQGAILQLNATTNSASLEAVKSVPEPSIPIMLLISVSSVSRHRNGWVLLANASVASQRNMC